MVFTPVPLDGAAIAIGDRSPPAQCRTCTRHLTHATDIPKRKYPWSSLTEELRSGGQPLSRWFSVKIPDLDPVYKAFGVTAPTDCMQPQVGLPGGTDGSAFESCPCPYLVAGQRSTGQPVISSSRWRASDVRRTGTTARHTLCRRKPSHHAAPKRR